MFVFLNYYLYRVAAGHDINNNLEKQTYQYILIKNKQMAGDKKPIVLVIEGLIGSGKTTLLNIIKERISFITNYKVVCVYEPVDEWRNVGILDKFYNAVTTKNNITITDSNYELINSLTSLVSYQFQTFALITRLSTIRKAYEENPDADIFILERSVIADKMFFVEMLKDSNMLNEFDAELYNKWWEFWRLMMPFDITEFIYLKPSLDECMRRLKIRARGEEIGVSRDYQEKLMRFHNALFRDDNNGTFELDKRIYPYTVFKTDEDFANDEKIKSDIVYKIFKLIKPITVVRF